MSPYTAFRGLEAKDLESFAGIKAIQHHRDPNSTYFMGSYAEMKRRKNELFRLIALFGQQEVNGQWHLHHIVEDQHLRPFFPSLAADRMYEHEWPVVLIHEKQHRAYDAVLHTADAMTIFGFPGKGAGVGGIDRERAKVRLKGFYSAAYTGNSVFQVVARNVIDSL